MKNNITILGFNILIQKDMELPIFTIHGTIITQQTKATLFHNKETNQTICRVSVAVKETNTKPINATIDITINTCDVDQVINKENILHYMYIGQTAIREVEKTWHIRFEETHVYIVQI